MTPKMTTGQREFHLFLQCSTPWFISSETRSALQNNADHLQEACVHAADCMGAGLSAHLVCFLLQLQLLFLLILSALFRVVYCFNYLKVIMKFLNFLFFIFKIKGYSFPPKTVLATDLVQTESAYFSLLSKSFHNFSFYFLFNVRVN